MSQLLEHAVAILRGFSPDMQDDLARVVLQLAGEKQPVFQLSSEEETSFDESFAQAARGEFVSDKAIEDIWAKYR